MSKKRGNLAQNWHPDFWGSNHRKFNMSTFADESRRRKTVLMMVARDLTLSLCSTPGCERWAEAELRLQKLGKNLHSPLSQRKIRSGTHVIIRFRKYSPHHGAVYRLLLFLLFLIHTDFHHSSSHHTTYVSTQPVRTQISTTQVVTREVVAPVCRHGGASQVRNTQIVMAEGTTSQDLSGKHIIHYLSS